MTERPIETHKGNVVNDALTILALGEPTVGGANHLYLIESTDRGCTNPSVEKLLRFQKGDPANGINGITNEALLAVVEDRLFHFQKGPFACHENQDALLAVRRAIAALHTMTAERIARGVEAEKRTKQTEDAT